MSEYGRFWLPGLLVALVLALAACGGPGAGKGSGVKASDSMDRGSSKGDTAQVNTRGTKRTEGSTKQSAGGMEGMDHGDVGGGDMTSEMLVHDGEYSDERFIDAMVVHHRGAVEMAEVALKKAEHPQIERLATNIIRTQKAEMGQLRSIKREEFGTPKVSMETSGEDMGRMGMMADPQKLAGRHPFDKAFIDSMIPHHESAIEMARVAHGETDNPEIKALTSRIIDAQTREIEQMTAWRNDWYPGG